MALMIPFAPQLIIGKIDFFYAHRFFKIGGIVIELIFQKGSCACGAGKTYATFINKCHIKIWCKIKVCDGTIYSTSNNQNIAVKISIQISILFDFFFAVTKVWLAFNILHVFSMRKTGKITILIIIKIFNIICKKL